MSNKIPFSFIEFQADTLHLTPCAVGIYIRLLCNILQTKKHLPLDMDKLERIAGAFTPNEKQELNNVLQTLFTLELDSYVNQKAEDMLNSFTKISQGARIAARARWVNQASSKRREGIPYQEIIDYLNVKTKPLRKPHARGFILNDSIVLDINRRFTEGHTLEDFKRAIDNKFAEWSNKKEFAVHLNPKTLFSDKMQNYCNAPISSAEAEAQDREQKKTRLISALDRLNKELTDCTSETRRRQLEAQIAGATMQLNSLGGLNN